MQFICFKTKKRNDINEVGMEESWGGGLFGNKDALKEKLVALAWAFTGSVIDRLRAGGIEGVKQINITDADKKAFLDHLIDVGQISADALAQQMRAKGYNVPDAKTLQTMAQSIPADTILPQHEVQHATEVAGGNPVYGAIVEGVVQLANSPVGQKILGDINDSAKKIFDDPAAYLRKIHTTIGPEAMAKYGLSTYHQMSEAQTQHELKQIDADIEKDKKEIQRLRGLGVPHKKALMMVREQRKPKGLLSFFGGNENAEAIMIAKIVVLVLFVIAFAVYFTYESPTARNITLSLGGAYLCLFLFEKFY